MKISFTLNGEKIIVDVHPLSRLLDVLRSDCGLIGTKEGCGEGECGACTVFLNGEIVMSCMVPVIQADGGEVMTIEGMASNLDLHPIQEAFLKYGGSQCGICTPGMILAAINYLKNPEKFPEGIAEALEGNLCRCTGYMRIFEAVEKSIVPLNKGGRGDRGEMKGILKR